MYAVQYNASDSSSKTIYLDIRAKCQLFLDQKIFFFMSMSSSKTAKPCYKILGQNKVLLKRNPTMFL